MEQCTSTKLRYIADEVPCVLNWRKQTKHDTPKNKDYRILPKQGLQKLSHYIVEERKNGKTITATKHKKKQPKPLYTLATNHRNNPLASPFFSSDNSSSTQFYLEDKLT